MTNSWSAGWVNGDIPTADEFSKGIGAIYDTTLTGAAASVDITGIIADYAHLLVVVYARGTLAATTANMSLRFNGVATGIHDEQAGTANAAVASAAESFASTLFTVATVPGATAPADVFGGVLIWIPHYAGSLDNKMLLVLAGNKAGTSSGNLSAGIRAGFWRSSAAINQLTFAATSGNIDTGSRITVYGMGG